MSYENWMKARAPSYMQDQYGQAWLGGIGAAFDDYLAQYVAGTLAAFPELAPADALPVIGDEVGLDRGPLETDLSYAARLRAAWIYWKIAGTPLGMLVALHFAGFPSAVITQQNGLAYNLSGTPVPGVDPTPLLVVTPTSQLDVALTPMAPAVKVPPSGTPWWAIDFNTEFCSRFQIIFPGPLPSSFVTWGTATFTGVENGGTVPWPLAVWNNIFADTTYHVAPAAPTITGVGAGVITWADATSKTVTGIRIASTAPFTGTVDVLAWQSGSNPFADPHPVDLARLQNVVRKWRPAKATCEGVYVCTEGKFAAWPVGTMAQMLSRPSTIVKLQGSY